MARANGDVLEHRLVVAESIGRALDPAEVVHHRDNDRSNNALENLELLPNDLVHRGIHVQARRELATAAVREEITQ